MIELSNAESAAIDWNALERVRLRAQAVGRAMTRETWEGLLADALKATGGRRGPALDMLALYGRPEWVATPSARA